MKYFREIHGSLPMLLTHLGMKDRAKNIIEVSRLQTVYQAVLDDPNKGDSLDSSGFFGSVQRRFPIQRLQFLLYALAQYVEALDGQAQKVPSQVACLKKLNDLLKMLACY